MSSFDYVVWTISASDFDASFAMTYTYMYINKQYHLNLYIDIFLRSFWSKHGVQITVIRRSIFGDYVRENFKRNDSFQMHNYIDNLFFDYTTFLLFCQCTFPCRFPWWLSQRYRGDNFKKVRPLAEVEMNISTENGANIRDWLTSYSFTYVHLY